MFLAPFGMLISKWAALKAFIDTDNVWVVLMLCFGSAVTLFYWAKWLGKLAAIVANRKNIQDKVHNEEWFVLSTHVVIVVIFSMGFPYFSQKVLIPLLNGTFGMLSQESAAALSDDNMLIMVMMVGLILILPLLFYGRTNKRIVPIYMAGANEGDNLTFRGSMAKEVPVSLRNWYMEGIFKETLMTRIGIIATCIIFTLSFANLISSVYAVFQFLNEGGVLQ